MSIKSPSKISSLMVKPSIVEGFLEEIGPPKNQRVPVGWYCYSSLNISAWAFAACTYYVETTVGCVLELLYTL